MSNYRSRKYKGKTRRARKTKAMKKSILKNKLVWDVVLGVIFVFSLSYLVFFSRVFEIRSVDIVAPGGLGHLVLQIKNSARQELNKPFLWALNKKSFFSASAKAINKRVLNEYPEVDAMIIKRVFPHGLFIELYDREEAAVWCYNEANCFFIDKKGVIFKSTTIITATSTDKGSSTDGLAVTDTELALIFSQMGSLEMPEDMIEDELLKEVISEEKLAQIFTVQKIFEKDISTPLSHFLTDGEEMLHAVTKQGWKVYFILGGDIEMAITRLKLLFEKELTSQKIKDLQYIDLRFSKVYYK